MSKLIFSVFAVLMISACQKEFKSEQNKFTYQYSVNGCSTGEHTFEHKSDMCSALANDQLNRGCARSLRAERYRAECGGTMNFYSTPQTFDMDAQLVASRKFSYQFVESECDTGHHEFALQEELCAALADDRLNGYCAPNMRQEAWQTQCSVR